MRWRHRHSTQEALRDAAPTLEALRTDQAALIDEVRIMREELRVAHLSVTEARTALTEALQVAIDDEATTRRLVAAARADPEYERAWTDENPLVSIVIPTYTNWKLLGERALPSALAQTHANIEVVVVGDTAPPETAAVIEAVDDPRVRFENLTVRGPYPEDARKRWFIAGTGPLNRAMATSRGRWIAFLNDDDAFRPEHLEVLLEQARRTRTEVAYTKLVQHAPDGSETIVGAFPPADHAFGWQLAIQHRSLDMFEYELAASLFDEPGDWHRARRMLRAGVSFSQVDRVTVDYFPSLLWTDPATS